MGIRRKNFWDRRARKLNKKKKHRRRKRDYRRNLSNPKSAISNRISSNDYKYGHIIKLPKIFSFELSLEETVAFISSMLSFLDKADYNDGFLLDAQEVIKVSADAIMYLIAMMKNYRPSRRKQFRFMGNYPLNKEARNIFIESGLLKFVKSKNKVLPKNNEKKTIISGKKNDAPVAGGFCRFICDKLGVSKVYTSRLYEVIIEMMSNVVYHAYSEDDEMVPEWYIYAEYINNQIKFIFLDTGVGIAKTVKKHRLYEKVSSKIGMASESRLIKSTLDGDFRTQTEKDYHGKGLPYIKEFAMQEKVKDFHIISGKGHCWIDENNEIIYRDMKCRLIGTVFSFSLIKDFEVICE